MNAARPPALWTGEDILAATGGQGRSDFAATGIAFDTRSLMAGDLFFALPGEERDGHEFVADALLRGAAAAIVSRMPTTSPRRPRRNEPSGIPSMTPVR